MSSASLARALDVVDPVGSMREDPGDIGTETEEELEQQHPEPDGEEQRPDGDEQGRDGGGADDARRPSSSSSSVPPSAAGVGTNRKAPPTEYDNLQSLLQRLERALEQERRAGAALEAIALRQWVEEAKDMDDPSSFLRPYLSVRLPSKMTLADKEASLEQTERLTRPWKCKRYKRRVRDVTEDYSSTVEWNSAFSHESFPDVLIALKFLVTTETPMLLPAARKGGGAEQSSVKIANLEVAFKDMVNSRRLLVLPAELTPLDQHCRNRLVPSEALSGFARYLSRSKARMDALERRGDDDVDVSAEGGLVVAFRNENGVELCRANWAVKFDAGSGGFRDDYTVEFTDAGRKSARECNFPEALLDSGRCADWTAEACVRNLERMASLDEAEEEEEETPPKRSRVSVTDGNRSGRV